ncbi:MAG: dihydropteroate synthase [Planctomyces sp.]|nr:dihydropteroate synthase [Planctomyces sp.]
MGILNVTPDSFSDGGRHNQLQDAIAQGLKLAEDGADIIDIGGESTRPGAEPVSLEDELTRTIPVIRGLVDRVRIPISIDTTKSEVARQAIEAGASIVNDISGMTMDPSMIDVCRNSQAGICLMHIQGTPQTMQVDPQYNDVVQEVVEFLRGRIEACLRAGISADRLCVDPGIGFGKSADHNIQLLKNVERIRNELSCPILIGHSRKRFLAKILGRPVEERLAGTLGVSIAMAERGADLLRIHDVQAVRDTLIAWQTLSPSKIS